MLFNVAKCTLGKGILNTVIMRMGRNWARLSRKVSWDNDYQRFESVPAMYAGLLKSTSDVGDYKQDYQE